MKASDFRFRKQYKEAVLKVIKKYRKDGATFEEIAVVLNDEKYETFTGNGKWHAQSIHRILNK